MHIQTTAIVKNYLYRRKQRKTKSYYTSDVKPSTKDERLQSSPLQLIDSASY